HGDRALSTLAAAPVRTGDRSHAQSLRGESKPLSHLVRRHCLIQAASITYMATLEVDTPHGQASAHLHLVAEPRAALVLGHRAAGGVDSGDLVAVTDVARAEEVSVALVEQPYRVAGRRSPAPARQLDAAWAAVVEHLVAG